MTYKEANKVLKELDEVRPEILNDKAKRLFNAIMKIADERDEYKAEIEKDNNIISDLQNEVTLKDVEIEKKDRQLKEKDNIIRKLNKEAQKNFDIAMDLQREICRFIRKDRKIGENNVIKNK